MLNSFKSTQMIVHELLSTIVINRDHHANNFQQWKTTYFQLELISILDSEKWIFNQQSAINFHFESYEHFSNKNNLIGTYSVDCKDLILFSELFRTQQFYWCSSSKLMYSQIIELALEWPPVFPGKASWISELSS